MTETMTMAMEKMEELILEEFDNASNNRGKEGAKQVIIHLIRKYGKEPKELDMLYKMLYPRIARYGLSFQFADYKTPNIIEGQAWENLLNTVKYIEMEKPQKDANPDCDTYVIILQHMVSGGLLHCPGKIKTVTRCLDDIIETGIVPEYFSSVMELCEKIKKEAELF